MIGLVDASSSLREVITDKQFLGGLEETIVVGIADSAILIGGKKATIIEEGE